jgi:hypothetical protein
MTSTPSSSLLPRSIFGRLALGIALAFVVFAIGIASLFLVSNPVRTLRHHVVTRESTWQRRVGLGLGPLTLGAARVGLFFARSHVPSEARTALSALRSASFEVYQHGNRNDPALLAGLVKADEEMSRGGWTRMVAVQNSDANVRVYLKESFWSKEVFNVAVVVAAEENLVFVSGRVDSVPLTSLAREKVHEKFRGLGRLSKNEEWKDSNQ